VVSHCEHCMHILRAFFLVSVQLIYHYHYSDLFIINEVSDAV